MPKNLVFGQAGGGRRKRNQAEYLIKGYLTEIRKQAVWE